MSGGKDEDVIKTSGGYTRHITASYSYPAENEGLNT